jgi:hypothetical protein
MKTVSTLVGLIFLGMLLSSEMLSQVKVKFQLNTATRIDTIKAGAMVQVRGSLPPLTWDNQSVNMTQVGGDYWQVEVTFHDTMKTKTLEYKFFASDWEAGNNRSLILPTTDTTLALTFYRQSGGDTGAPPYTPSDSIDVWFRVHMGSEANFNAGSDIVGVRGSQFPLDWGQTYQLSREGTSKFYSGVIRFSNSVRGSVVSYKFVYGTGPNWEEGSDRTVTLGNDTTLHWKTFSNKPILSNIVSGQILASVNVRAYELLGIFNQAAGDSMQMRGPFNGWGGGPADKMKMLQESPGSSVWYLPLPYTGAPEEQFPYKFYIDFEDPASRGYEDWWGWELPATVGGGNRSAIFAGTNDQTLPTWSYNDLPTRGIIPTGDTVEVTFTIDMRPAFRATVPFNPSQDTVRLVLPDPTFAKLQGRTPGTQSNLIYSDPDNDSIYTLKWKVKGPSPYFIMYQVRYGNNPEEGGGFDEGRYRTRYIRPNPDGSYPRTYTLTADVYTQNPPLPIETPPLVTSVPSRQATVPASFALAQNFPNPFNPTTTIQFSLPAETFVTIKVYNIVGQTVATVLHDKRPAGTHAVAFDASHLPSGVYFYQINAGSFVQTKKMVVLK